jgi:hypothetical protein
VIGYRWHILSWKSLLFNFQETYKVADMVCGYPDIKDARACTPQILANITNQSFPLTKELSGGGTPLGSMALDESSRVKKDEAHKIAHMCKMFS